MVRRPPRPAVPIADLPAAEHASTVSRSSLPQPSVHDHSRTKPIADFPAEAGVQADDKNSYGATASADFPAGAIGEITILAIVDREDYDSTTSNAAIVADLLAADSHTACRIHQKSSRPGTELRKQG